MATKRLTKSGKYVKDEYVSRPKPKAQKRNCLCCGKLFTSAGWYNRLCDRCRKL